MDCRRILIVKVGHTYPSLSARRGDFEDWIASGLGVDPTQITIADVTRALDLPPPDGVSGVVVSGSHEMVTHRAGWSERTGEWLAEVVRQGVPTLGICYGHQLLAHALGGDVRDNPSGPNFGTVDVHLLPDTGEDALFRGLSSPLKAHVVHTQSVLRLPSGARRLASSEMDPNQAFVLGHTAWGVQFHPEFDRDIVTEYISQSAAHLRRNGVCPEASLQTCTDTPSAALLLARFSQIALGSGT